MTGTLTLVIETKKDSGAAAWIAKWYGENAPLRRVATMSPYSDILRWINSGLDVAALVKSSDFVRLSQLRRMAEVHQISNEEHTFS